jgi:hypothetical protein
MKLYSKMLAAEKAIFNLANRGWIFGLKIEFYTDYLSMTKFANHSILLLFYEWQYTSASNVRKINVHVNANCVPR